MNAESTVFRSSRSAVVLSPGGEGARAAAWLLAWPMRLAGTVMGRRVLIAVALAVTAVATVGWLYDSADSPRAVAAVGPAGLASAKAAATGGAGDLAATRRNSAAPARAKAASAAQAAAAWWAARQKVALDKVQALGQRRVSRTEVQVLVMAEAGGSRMPSRYVTVRKGADGWKVP
jgi:hypothetical protein